VLAAAPPDAVAAVISERRGCDTGEGSRKCGGGELRHRPRGVVSAAAASYGTGCCCGSDCKGQRQAASVWECKRQRLLLLLRWPCPSQKARFFKLFSFFLCSLRIGLLDVNGSE